MSMGVVEGGGRGGAESEQSDGVICWTVPTVNILFCISPLYSTRERCLTIQNEANVATFASSKLTQKKIR